MKNLNLLKTTWVVLLITASLFVKAQVPPGIVPATGIPVLVPATLGELNVPNGYCQLTYGTSGLNRSTTSCVPLTLTGHNVGSVSPSSHLIINSGSSDTRACIQGVPGVFLTTFPNIQFWDTTNYGVPRVMRMGDENAGSFPSASSASTYYFVPTEEQNVLVFWFAFVTQSVDWYDKSENSLFRVEMTDVNGNFITGSAQNSTFYIIPETTSDPILHPCCQPLLVRYTCPGSINNFWADWVRLAFDLRPYIGQPVRLRVIVSECVYQAHWTYCYFTGYGLKGSIDVQACGDDNISLQAPKGFENYVWYINNLQVYSADGLSNLIRARNTSETNFRCEMTSQTGAPFVFIADVNYYELFPDYTWEQIFDGSINKVEFTNTSEIYKINNGENVSQTIQYVLWDFGDGNTSTELNPIHYYSGVGPFIVKLKIYDNDSLCSKEISEQVLLSGVSVNEVNTQSISCKAYPNPFKEEIILEVSNTNEMVSYEILNLLGQVVYQGKMIHQCKVQANQFEAGVYVIKFSKGDQTFYSKIVKE